MIKQKGTEWECSICGEIFGRVENAIVHDFKEHSVGNENRTVGSEKSTITNENSSLANQERQGCETQHTGKA